MSNNQRVKSFSLFTDFDIYLFRSGKHFDLHERSGSHLVTYEGEDGVYFAVWAPNAKNVSVIGDFNHWQSYEHNLYPRWDDSGIWEGFIPNLKKGTIYKYHIHSNLHDQQLEKGDPFAFFWEVPPRTASLVWDLDYTWKDSKWMKERVEKNALDRPFSVYEVHLGSWKRNTDEWNRSLNYTELATDLVNYVKEMGFTHIEFMPVMEHPFFGSWGYQVTGYFAPSSRFGTPQEFMEMIDAFHEAGIGVLLDWVPSHFPSDGHGLYRFDGTSLYEHEDERQGYHPDWKSHIFNYGRNEVRSFLISNASFWAKTYHADGLRVDAVASMLYLDYSRKAGEWIPNEYGGRENLPAISLLKEMNEHLYGTCPGIQTIAEESTAWPNISRPTFIGGLGFGMKWMMGWMNDTLNYFSRNPYHRRYHQGDITFSLVYAFTENFMLPLSHDEVVHGKGSLLARMPGDEWQRFANLRLLYAYMYTHPGTKLLFMGAEVAQGEEWKHDYQVHWHLLQYSMHKGVSEMVKKMNHVYTSEPALYECGFEQSGFEWIDYNDQQNSIISYIRKGKSDKDKLVVVCNFTPVARENYRIGVIESKQWEEIFNTDHTDFGGSGFNPNGVLDVDPIVSHWREQSLSINVPPLGVVILKLKA